MSQTPSDFMEEGAPVAQLFRRINSSFYETYEFDKHDYSEGGIWVDDDQSPAVREKWGLDLSKVNNTYDTWSSRLSDVQNHALYHVVANAQENEEELNQFFSDKESGAQPNKAMKNISNAWRDEFALNDPLDGDVRDRMRTAEWRITMAYYSIYKATSALMRSKFSDKKEGGSDHDGMWRYHMREVMDELGNSLYAYPFMFFPRDSGPHSSKWFEWTVPYPMIDENWESQREIMATNAKSALSSIYSKAREGINWEDGKPVLVTFYDLLLQLRHWANYQEGGIFSRLYGDGYRQFIDEGLRLITFIGMAIAEVGLIYSLGFGRFYSQYKRYARSCREGVEEGLGLIERRMNVYEQAFSE
jgi:hypothetical protein